jgi:hypothetical protein
VHAQQKTLMMMAQPMPANQPDRRFTSGSHAAEKIASTELPDANMNITLGCAPVQERFKTVAITDTSN